MVDVRLGSKHSSGFEINLILKLTDRSLIKPFQFTVAFCIKNSHLFCSVNHDWVLFEIQHWAEIG